MLDAVPTWWVALDSGDKPTWLAAVFAGFAFLFTARTVYNSEQDRRRREEREESEQARYVRVSQVTNAGGASRSGDVVLIPMKVTLSNESPDAIHDVSIRFEVLPASVVVAGGLLTAERSVFASGHEETFSLGAELKAPGGEVPDFYAAPTVEFTDIEGRRWRRDRDYRLTEIKK